MKTPGMLRFQLISEAICNKRNLLFKPIDAVKCRLGALFFDVQKGICFNRLTICNKKLHFQYTI
jgi:hypothetical protein